MKKVLKIILFGIIALFILGLILPDSDDSSPASSSDPQTNAQQASEPKEKDNDYIKAGMYKIGDEIPAGVYTLYASGMGYFQVTKDSSGSLESILANDTFSTTSIIEVKEGQYLEMKSAKALPFDKAPTQEPVDGKYVDGMYKVGKDLPAGEYKVVPDGDMAYFERAKDATHYLSSILANDNFEDEKYVTVNDGEYIKLLNCYLKAKE